tara:strand:- start:96153 stop:96338 length:186 start_codon:yes stop_codon:yes gene_type:complete
MKGARAICTHCGCDDLFKISLVDKKATCPECGTVYTILNQEEHEKAQAEGKRRRLKNRPLP